MSNLSRDWCCWNLFYGRTHYLRDGSKSKVTSIRRSEFRFRGAGNPDGSIIRRPHQQQRQLEMGVLSQVCGAKNLKIQRLTTTRSLPVGAVVNFTFLLGMPSNFPNPPSASTIKKNPPLFISRASLAKLDVLGASLLLSGSLLLTTALLEVSHRFSWSSGGSISLLTVSGLSWICFILWEWYITGKDGKQEPVFLWRFVRDRSFMGMLMYGSFCSRLFLKVTNVENLILFAAPHFWLAFPSMQLLCSCLNACRLSPVQAL